MISRRRYGWLFMLLGVILMGSPMEAWAQSVRLGIVLAQTGIGADENAPALKAAQLAIEEINEAGGLLGHRLELVVADTGGTPLGAKKAAETIIQQGVIGVIGAFRSSHCLAMAPVIDNARIPMISPTATNPDVTKGHDFIFRTCFTDEFQGQAMAEFARQKFKARTAAVLTNITENYCISLAGFFAADFKALGGKVLWEGEYQGSATDFKQVLENVKAFQPEIVFLPGYAHDSGLLICQSGSYGIRTVFLGADAWDWGVEQFAGKALEGAFHSTHWFPDYAIPRNLKLKAAFRARYGPDGYNDMQIPLTYDAILLFADAVKRAGSMDSGKVRQALSKTKNFKGAAGSITFDSNRNPIGKDVVIMQFTDGAWRYCQSIQPHS